ncbi:hypothetical protein [Microbacterium sp.]|mgnify:FL=1|jgi:hypothetical protein|uniref:hypothetical protein n=1 Tax=unclassified Microbacterium TaxID=2609290 RepID=UPI000E030125|nr:MAG: hypothetical protein DBW62_02115 [Microbacterium sp.]
MTADEPLFELADVGLELAPTEAMRRGEQFVHQCAWCGAVVVWHRRKTTDSLGLCPNCGSDAGGNPAESSTWWRQRLPLAGIAPLGLAARNRLVDELIAQLHTSEITEWDEARVAAWLRACAAAPHASLPGDGGDR